MTTRAIPSLVAPSVSTRNARPIRVADSGFKNPFKALFSIFKKKPRPLPQIRRVPARIIVGPGGNTMPGRFATSSGRQDRHFISRYYPDRLQANPDQSRRRRYAGLRTMCVRLCDGYYWPLSSRASNGRLIRDEQRCESSCGRPARLFVMSAGGDDIANMRDMDGKPYRALKTAFSYRKTFNAQCRCRAEPWSQRARLRHRAYGAVGRERREISIKTAMLDLRPGIRDGSVGRIDETVIRAAQPLPLRNPARAFALAAATTSTIVATSSPTTPAAASTTAQTASNASPPATVPRIVSRHEIPTAQAATPQTRALAEAHLPLRNATGTIRLTPRPHEPQSPRHGPPPRAIYPSRTLEPRPAAT